MKDLATRPRRTDDAKIALHEETLIKLGAAGSSEEFVRR